MNNSFEISTVDDTIRILKMIESLQDVMSIQQERLDKLEAEIIRVKNRTVWPKTSVRNRID